MAFNKKKVALVVFLAVAIISFVMWMYKKHERLDNHITGPGSFVDPSLKFVAVVFRHGDRAPTFKYKTDPHANAFPEGKGELTKRGKQHMYKKGKIFRHQYNGYLSDLYLDSEILIKTTYPSRAYMSAAMVLAGLYPPRHYQKWSNLETVWQPIPIHEDSPDHGTLFYEHGVCPAFESVSSKWISELYNKTDKNITEPLLSYMSEKCGEPINFVKLRHLYDLFLCQIAAGLQLPEWITPHHMQTMYSLLRNREDLKLFYGNLKLQKFIEGPLLKEIGLAMESRSNSSNHNTTRKMHLYSGHDISILTLMGILGNNIETPDFGASLHFHLYFDKTIGYTIKVFYFYKWDNDRGEEVSISICGNPCKIQDFMKFVTDNFSEKWEHECQKVEA